MNVIDIINNIRLTNLLINSDFRNPINQRGKTVYNTNGYSIDRWILQNENTTLTVNHGYCTLAGDHNVLFQNIEFPTLYSNKEITLSAKVKGSGGGINLTLYSTELDKILASKTIDTTDWQEISVSCTIGTLTNDSKRLSVSVEGAGADSIDIEWVKLEEGSVATPFISRSFGEELLLCQTYLQSDHVFVTDTEPDKDGIWISSDNTTTVTDNPTLVALKEYVNTQISNQNDSFNEKLGTIELTTDDKTIKGAINEHETQINDNTVQLKEMANLNLLINGDFRNPVNQRNQKKYVEHGRYSIDRWSFISDNTGVSTQNYLQVNDGYISMYGYANSKHTQLVQPVEFPNLYTGKEITISVKYRIPTGKNAHNFRIYSRLVDSKGTSNWLFNDTLIADGRWHIYTKTYTVPNIDNPASFIPVWISCINFDFNKLNIVANLDENCQIDLEYAKAEIGSQATPFIPRLYGEELALCKRYYQKFEFSAIMDSHGRLPIYANISMRTIPTVTKISTNTITDDLTLDLFGTGYIKFKNLYLPINDKDRITFIQCVPMESTPLSLGTYDGYMLLDTELYI